MAVVFTSNLQGDASKKLKAGKAIRFVNRRNYVLCRKSNLRFALSYLDLELRMPICVDRLPRFCHNSDTN